MTTPHQFYAANEVAVAAYRSWLRRCETTIPKPKNVPQGERKFNPKSVANRIRDQL